MPTSQRSNRGMSIVANTEAQQSPTLAQLGEWLTLIAAIVVVLGGLLGGCGW